MQEEYLDVTKYILNHPERLNQLSKHSLNISTPYSSINSVMEMMSLLNGSGKKTAALHKEKIAILTGQE